MVLNKIKLFGATVTSLYLLASACTGGHQTRLESGSYAPLPASSKQAQTITITRSGSQPTRQTPAQYFTGAGRIDPLFETKDPSHTSGSYLTFEPGARSAWHTHPLGRTRIVTAGTIGGSMISNTKANALPPMLPLDDVRMIAPTLVRYTQGVLFGDLWKPLIYRRAIAASSPSRS